MMLPYRCFFEIKSRIRNPESAQINAMMLCFIQRDKLRFEFIPVSFDHVAFKNLISDIAKGYKWSIRSFRENTVTIKTNPGFVNASWGQHITIVHVKGGVLVNSIFDPNKGGWLITFGSNRKNIDNVKKLIDSAFTRSYVTTSI